MSVIHVKGEKTAPLKDSAEDRGALSLSLAIIVAITITGLSGCSNDISDLEQYVAQIKKKHLGEVEPLPEIVSYQSFTYDASLVSDPFVAEQAIEETLPSASPLPDQQRRREPLEAFSLDSLKMVGALEQDNTIWGLVQDPNGTIHRVQAGSYAGENDGKIIDVNETKISINELIPDSQGNWVNRAVSISLGDQ